MSSTMHHLRRFSPSIQTQTFSRSFLLPLTRPSSAVSGRAFATSSANDSPRTLSAIRDDLRRCKERKANLEQEVLDFRAQGKKNILCLGAGRSSGVLIDYLLKSCEKHGWFFRLGDYDLDVANEKIAGHETHSVAFQFDATDSDQLNEEVSKADVVISLVPVPFQKSVAEQCINSGVDMVAASYATPEIQALSSRAEDAGVLLMMECGLDPGIDHMITMQVLDRIRASKGTMLSLESFTGGLVAPASDDNPWHYKFSWNPRNVVLAGQGVCKFIHNGRYKYIPYHKVFSRREFIRLPDLGDFEGIANRDSLKYRDIYDLHDCPTLYRGTLRRPGFCAAWDIFVQLGMTDDTYVIEDSERMTYRDFINSFLTFRAQDSVELKLAYHMGLSMDSPEMRRLQWLGIFEQRKIGLKQATPAQILQRLLERKLQLKPEDRDLIVMYNKFVYETEDGQMREIISTLGVEGEQGGPTAMSTTVGLPAALIAEQMLLQRVPLLGVKIPTLPQIYEPVLDGLARVGIKMNERESEVRRADVF